MESNEDLLKQLIKKKTGFSESSFDNKKILKKCLSSLRQYHPLEINPKFVNSEIEQLCEKLQIHSLDFKSVALTNMYKKLIKSCDCSLDPDNYLMMHGIVLFLLEINGCMVNSYEYEEIVVNDDILINETVDWGEILTKSEDIYSLTRHDYRLDDSSDNYSETETEENDTKTSVSDEKEIPIVDSVKDDCYDLVRSENFDKSEIQNDCQLSLQSEYWLDSFDTKSLSKNLNSKRNFSVFIDDWEKYIQQVNPDYYLKEYRNRVEISEYQLIREIIDVLMGSYSSFLFKLEYDSQLITKNRFKVLKSCKLINLSWKSVDNILEEFAQIASYCLNLRAVCSHITRSNYQTIVPPSIVALGERLHFYISQFNQMVLGLETESRGNQGLSLFHVLNAVNHWANRLKFLWEIVLCVSSNRFEVLNCPSTVISVLNLLSKMMNESCVVLTDAWMQQCTLDLFYHTLKPYLYSLDALLSGQVHISSQNLFLTPSKVAFSRQDIGVYWNFNFSFKTQKSDRSLLHHIPVFLQLFIVQLISTIKSIDLLRLLSNELTQPAIIKPIIIEPGRFIEHFNPSRTPETRETVSVYQFAFQPDFILPGRHAITLQIAADLAQSVSLTHEQSVASPCRHTVFVQPEPAQDLVESCRNLHRNLYLDILDRYKSVNSHLISVFISCLGLRSALDALKSVFFFQAGLEMSDFSCHLFDLISHFSYDPCDLGLNLNVKLHQILTESVNGDIRHEALRFSVKFPSDTRADSELGFSQTLLSNIVVGYAVEWSLKLVITDDVLTTCNRCFRFLLQLRFAKHCLERRIHSERHSARKWSPLSNRMCSLRLKLLQVVNNFHGYVMNTFIIPSWDKLDTMIKEPGHFEDFTDFIHGITEPFQTMLRGCLQCDEMTAIEKAIKTVVMLGIETAQINVGTDGSMVKNLEMKYKRLIDFLSGIFRSLAHLGISIGELDISAFE